MFPASRTFLIIFLALLQLIAPLVHAHAGENFFAASSHDSGKLHVPGLEAFADNNIAMVLDTEPTPHRHRAAISNAQPPEGMVIDINTGIKHSRLIDTDDVDHLYLPQPPIIFQAPLALFDRPAPHSRPYLLSRYLFSLHSPRAPPVQ